MVIIFTVDFQRIAKLRTREGRGRRNYNEMVADGMRPPIDIEFRESTACKLAVLILRSSLFNDIIPCARSSR